MKARVGLVALCGLFLFACSRTADDVALRDAIAEMASAIAHKEPKALLSRLAPDFAGGDNLDREGARRLMAYHFLRNPRVRVLIHDVQIELRGDEARTRARAALAGGEGIVPERAQYYDIAGEWRRSDNGWLLHRARWEPAFAPGG